MLLLDLRLSANSPGSFLALCGTLLGTVLSGVGDSREPGRPLLWRRSGYRYPIVVLAVGQRGLLPRYQRPDTLALLQHQREPLDLFVGHAFCSLSALPSYRFQELIFHALLG